MEEETLYERLAREKNITVEELISGRIEAGMNAPDLEKRVQWEKDTPLREDTHAGGVAPICGVANGGRMA